MTEKIRNVNNIIVIIALLVFFGILTSGVFIHQRKHRITTTYAPVIATVISQSYVSDDNKYHTVYEYTFNFQRYNGSYRTSKSMNAGATFRIYVNPENPLQVYSDESLRDAQIGIYLGAVFALIFVVAFGATGRKLHNSKNPLKKTGVRFRGRILSTTIHSQVRYNHRSPFSIRCKGIINGEPMEVTSKWFFEPHFADNEGYIVDIYQDPKNKSKLFVDLDSMREVDEFEASMFEDPFTF